MMMIMYQLYTLLDGCFYFSHTLQFRLICFPFQLLHDICITFLFTQRLPRYMNVYMYVCNDDSHGSKYDSFRSLCRLGSVHHRRAADGRTTEVHLRQLLLNHSTFQHSSEYVHFS